jgi:hypothetical protein
MIDSVYLWVYEAEHSWEGMTLDEQLEIYRRRTCYRLEL